MNKEITAYIESRKSPQKEICNELRNIILKTFPGINEEMKWGVPTFASGKYYIVALKEHVNLGFLIKGLSENEISFFQGSGKTMRVIEFTSIEEIDEHRVVKLLNLIKK